MRQPASFKLSSGWGSSASSAGSAPLESVFSSALSKIPSKLSLSFDSSSADDELDGGVISTFCSLVDGLLEVSEGETMDGPKDDGSEITGDEITGDE